jgi:hypothetical protein
VIVEGSNPFARSIFLYSSDCAKVRQTPPFTGSSACSLTPFDASGYATFCPASPEICARICIYPSSHWAAIENGTHYRRDVTLGEDANRTTERKGAAALASLRNLANGLHELEREAQRTRVDTPKSWCQQQLFSTLWPLLRQ